MRSAKQIAESLVNMGRGGYRPAEVVALIARGIEQSRTGELERQRDTAAEELERRGQS